MITGAQVVVGEITVEVKLLGLPQPSLHGLVSPDATRAQQSRLADQLIQQPIANHIETVVIDAAVHQAANHQVMLHRHQPFRMNGQFAVGRQGDRTKDAIKIQLAISGTSAVTVSQEIIQTIAVKLAAHQGLDDAPFCTSMFEKIGHRGSCAC